MSEIKVGDKYYFRNPNEVYTVTEVKGIHPQIYCVTLKRLDTDKPSLNMTVEFLKEVGNRIEEPKPKLKIEVGDKFLDRRYPGVPLVFQSDGHFRVEGGSVYFYSEEDIQKNLTPIPSEAESNFKAEIRGILGIAPDASIQDAIKELKRYKLCVENVRKEIEGATPKLG